MYRSNYSGKDPDAMLNYLKEARREYRRNERKRTAAAIVDFATNLLAQVGRSKGLRYDVVGRPVAGEVASRFDEAAERYRKAMIDYKGALATEKLKSNETEKPTEVKSQETVMPAIVKPAEVKSPETVMPATVKYFNGVLNEGNPILFGSKSSLAAPMFLKPSTHKPVASGYGKPYENIVRKIENIKTPTWYIDNKKDNK